MSGDDYSFRGRVVEARRRAGLAGLRVVATNRVDPGASVLVDGTTDTGGHFVLVFAADDALALLSSSATATGIWDAPLVLHLSAYDGERRLGIWTRTTSARALLSGGDLGDVEVEDVATAPIASLIARVQTAGGEPAGGEPIAGLDAVLERISLTSRARVSRGVTDQDGAAPLDYALGRQGTRTDTGIRLQLTISADGRELARSAVLFALADAQEVVVGDRRRRARRQRVRSLARRDLAGDRRGGARPPRCRAIRARRGGRECLSATRCNLRKAQSVGLTIQPLRYASSPTRKAS